MRTRKDLHNYQVRACSFIKDNKASGLFVDMGLGKTVVSLTAASDLLDDFLIDKVLVVAPLRVANTVWHKEASEWEHLKHLDIKVCTGSAASRKKVIQSDPQVMVINRENFVWLVNNFKWNWDMLIIDESSGFKSHRSRRFRAVKKIAKYLKSAVLLTGTPSPNGQMDLWSQLYIIDRGERLGRTISNYRKRFFKSSGYMGYGYSLLDGAKDKINELIKDVCLSMRSEDYLDIPKAIPLREVVRLPSPARKLYNELEKEYLIELTDTDIEVETAAVLSNKLLQMANGAIYDENKKTHEIHSAKIDALKEIIEDNPGENFFIAYNFKSDLIRIKKAFPKAIVLSPSGKELDDWNEGKIRMLLAHPASAGHGLNAQYGGSIIVWFGLNWSLELYQQFNARLVRQGQTKPVRIMHIVAEKTVDEVLMKALDGKAQTQEEILAFLRRDLLMAT